MTSTGPRYTPLGVAAVTVVLMLAACGSTTTAAGYTLKPLSPLGAGITVRIAGPRAEARRVLAAFNASRRGDYTTATNASGQKDCAVPAAGGRVTISVYGTNAFSQVLCSAIRGRF